MGFKFPPFTWSINQVAEFLKFGLGFIIFIWSSSSVNFLHLRFAPFSLLQKNATTNKKITFWFATGGAGFCLSRALTLKMLPIAGGGKFISIGDKIRFPDDVTMGFIIGE